jgi:hypothetical protein
VYSARPARFARPDAVCGNPDMKPAKVAVPRGLHVVSTVNGLRRWAEDQPDRLPAIAAERVQRRVAVIVATGIAMPALKAATAAIPIIFVTGYDPVRTGFVTSLSRPGGAR